LRFLALPADNIMLFIKIFDSSEVKNEIKNKNFFEKVTSLLTKILVIHDDFKPFRLAL